MAPLFTVITVSYNSERFIGETIQSVLQQRYTNFEYLILDDHSTDGSWGCIQQVNDPRIVAIQHPKNIGEYNNRNKGIQMANGKYILFIDADDFLYPHALEIFSHYIEHFPDCAQIFCREWKPEIKYPYKLSPKEVYLFEYLGSGIMGRNLTKTLFLKSALEQVGFFKPNIRTGDIHIQLRIAAIYPSLVINDGLTWWRRRSGNATERLFSNYRYMAETLGYELEFLNASTCPLSEKEVEMAKQNIYGLFLRNLLRMLLKGKWADGMYLFKEIKVPRKYWRAVFKPAQFSAFKNYNGDNPLHTAY